MPERTRAVLAPMPAGKRPRAVMALCVGVAEPQPQPKESPARAEGYRRWVASLPCIVCGLDGFSQAAHPNHGRGLGQKASDLDCFPLCCTRSGYPGHHWEHDNLYQMTLEERRERELRYTAQTQTLGRQAGRPELLEAA